MSYSSCGVAEGGKVASWGDAGATLRGCGGGEGVVICDAGTGIAPAVATAEGGATTCGGGASLPASVDRSSGAPATRPPGAPTGDPLSCVGSGAAITA